MQECGDNILFVQFMIGRKGKGVDAAKLTVRPVLDELFDGADWLWFRRLP